MAKQEITEPLMLDSTGVKILTALRQIMISTMPVDNLTTADATLPLSANQGRVLKGLIDTNTASISSLMNQSTSEVAIGTTYDGFTIYKKHFHGNLQNQAGYGRTEISTSYTNANTRMIGGNGYVNSTSGNTMQLGSSLNATWYCGLYLNNYALYIYHSDEVNGGVYDFDFFFAKLS